MATAEPWRTVMVKDLRQAADKATPSIPNTLALSVHRNSQTHPRQPTRGQAQGPSCPASRCSLNFAKFFIKPKINTKQTAEQEIQTANHPLPLPLLLLPEHLRVQHWLGN